MLCAMFGPRLNTVFANRWNALLWCAGVLFTVYWMIPAPEPDPTEQAQQTAQASHKPHKSESEPHHRFDDFDTTEIDKLTKQLEEMEKNGH